MKNSIQIIKPIASKALFIIYGINKFKINFKYTKKEFIGDITWIIFPIFKIIQESSKIIGEKLGNYIMKESKIINSFNLIEGYLNLKCKKKYYINFFKKIKYKNFSFFLKKKKNKKKLIMIEYSSPNANKPLHLGHIRNNLLGNSIANIFKYIGYKVIRTQIINDRGIHICKSMVTWKKYSNGDTPENTGIKGDHFVGKYYIKFDKIYNKEKKKNIKIPIMESAKKMLKKWESGDKIILNIWKKMNKWVYKGFKDTYNSLGIKFDETQYESKTYIFGKKIIKKGLIKGIFYKKKDGSIWVDLSNKGLDKKLLLRSDGTSLYITQDIGTVIERFKKYFFNKLIYVVGEEQNYHFKVLFSILKLLKYSWEKNLFHLSYGMVDLPNGKKMQSRKGTVVNADYLIKKMHKKSKKIILKSNKFSKFSKKKKKKL
jgi:arginyl-tRNA synthetase